MPLNIFLISLHDFFLSPLSIKFSRISTPSDSFNYFIKLMTSPSSILLFPNLNSRNLRCGSFILSIKSFVNRHISKQTISAFGKRDKIVSTWAFSSNKKLEMMTLLSSEILYCSESREKQTLFIYGWERMNFWIKFFYFSSFRLMFVKEKSWVSKGLAKTRIWRRA